MSRYYYIASNPYCRGNTSCAQIAGHAQSGCQIYKLLCTLIRSRSAIDPSHTTCATIVFLQIHASSYLNKHFICLIAKSSGYLTEQAWDLTHSSQLDRFHPHLI